MYYKDKVIWITGASSGIGESLAYALNRKGAQLILSARREEELKRVQQQCVNGEETVATLPLDLTRPETFAEKRTEAEAHFGPVDILFNNGGISQRAYAVDSEMHTIRKLMEVNFFGTVALTKEVLPGMMERGHGHIVVTSSVMGKIGTRYRSAYAASKHALHGWFDCLRQEVADKQITVTLLCPGFVRTNITKEALTADGKALNEMGDAHQKAMSAEEFAEKALPKISAGKEEIFIGGFEIVSVYLKRLSPKLLHRILLRSKVT
ncbi:MAG: SDR family oxidoreductase [Balneolaceae bacterium]